MAAGREESHQIDGRTVRVVEVELGQYPYERSRWAVFVDDRQRGWILHPKGFGKPAQLWAMGGKPNRRARPDYREFLDEGYQKENVRQRAHLAGRLLDFMARGLAPSLEEVESAKETASLAEETRKSDYERRRAVGIAKDADNHEAMLALRERLGGLGVLTNHETEVLDKALKDLLRGYQYDTIKELDRRKAAREEPEGSGPAP